MCTMMVDNIPHAEPFPICRYMSDSVDFILQSNTLKLVVQIAYMLIPGDVCPLEKAKGSICFTAYVVAMVTYDVATPR